MSQPKKKLLIDGQIFQTAAKNRGMGRYTAYLISSILSQKHGYDSVQVILSAHLPQSAILKKELRAEFRGAELKTLNLLSSEGRKIEEAFEHNQAELDRYVDSLANNAQISFLIPALFQEPTAMVFPHDSIKLLVFYDLIPYLYHTRYEPVIDFPNYLKRFKYLFMADKIFTISQTVKDDLRVYLGLPAERLVCIDGAAIISKLAPQKPTIKLPEKFLLMPTSDDLRKNNLRMVLGFEEFRLAAAMGGYKLVITSTISEKETEHLKMFSKNLIFTGNLPDQQIDWLYEHCQAVLFAPEYEGLGLPVLEAAVFKKSVICSAIGVFKEISPDAFHYCDYENPTSIALALEQALSNPPDLTKYRRFLTRYTWPKTAKRFLNGAKDISKASAAKPKLAIFTPKPDGLSAIGKVVAETHPELSRLFDVDYFVERGVHNISTRPDYLHYVANTYPVETFSAKIYSRYDAIVYHIGNSDYHLETIKNALIYPGYVVLHDTNLRAAFEILHTSGLMQSERLRLEESLDVIKGPTPYTGLTTLADRQLGVITHSAFAAAAAKKAIQNKVPIIQTNLPTAGPELPPSRTDEPIVIGLAGIIADIKGLEVIEEIANNPAFSSCVIKLFGFNHASDETVERLNNYENVSVIIGPTDFEFRSMMSKLHIYVNFRLGYHGETSLSTIEAMRDGVAVIVRDIGWYGELPDDVVRKASDTKEVFQQLNRLINNRKELHALGQKAAWYINAYFNHRRYVLAIKDALGQMDDTNQNNYLARELKNGRIKTVRQYIRALKAGGLI